MAIKVGVVELVDKRVGILELGLPAFVVSIVEVLECVANIEVGLLVLGVLELVAIRVDILGHVGIKVGILELVANKLELVLVTNKVGVLELVAL